MIVLFRASLLKSLDQKTCACIVSTLGATKRRLIFKCDLSECCGVCSAQLYSDNKIQYSLFNNVSFMLCMYMICTFSFFQFEHKSNVI